MDVPVLTDPKIFPDETVLASHLGKARAAYYTVFDYNHEHFPEFVEKWKYYQDGKSWLLNVSHKKKTVFWLTVRGGFFRVGVYLGSKSDTIVAASTLPKELKDHYRASAGKSVRGISLVVRTKKDVEVYKKLIDLKKQCSSRQDEE